MNADDLDTMWVLLRENCSIEEASGTEKVWNASPFMTWAISSALSCFAILLEISPFWFGEGF